MKCLLSRWTVRESDHVLRPRMFESVTCRAPVTRRRVVSSPYVLQALHPKQHWAMMIVLGLEGGRSYWESRPLVSKYTDSYTAPGGSGHLPVPPRYRWSPREEGGTLIEGIQREMERKHVNSNMWGVRMAIIGTLEWEHWHHAIVSSREEHGCVISRSSGAWSHPDPSVSQEPIYILTAEESYLCSK
jgi:hypothetical protein